MRGELLGGHLRILGAPAACMRVRTCTELLLPRATTRTTARRLAQEEGEEGPLDEDDLLLARMDAGLYTLQQVRLGGSF